MKRNATNVKIWGAQEGIEVGKKNKREGENREGRKAEEVREAGPKNQEEMIRDDFLSLFLWLNFMANVSSYDELSSFMMNVLPKKEWKGRRFLSPKIFVKRPRLLVALSSFSGFFLLNFLQETNLSLHHHKTFVFSFSAMESEREQNKNRKRRNQMKLDLSDDAIDFRELVSENSGGKTWEAEIKEDWISNWFNHSWAKYRWLKKWGNWKHRYVQGPSDSPVWLMMVEWETLTDLWEE